MLGPQDDAFTEKGLLISNPRSTPSRRIPTAWPPSSAARRLEAKAGVDILSDGIVEGSVQVSANGQPIVMLADHQSTGGYAKIATVIPCDIPALAQVRPGQLVGFRVVSVEEGAEACRKEKKNGRISRRRSTMTDYASARPKDVRALIRAGQITSPTTGMCDGYAQGNLVVLPKGTGVGFSAVLPAQPEILPAARVADAGSRTFPSSARAATLRAIFRNTASTKTA